MNKKPNAGNILQQLPTKWAVALVVLFLGYAFIQPMLKKQFGWNLPSLASLNGQPDPQPPNVGSAGRDSGDDSQGAVLDLDKINKKNASSQVEPNNSRGSKSGTSKQDGATRKSTEPPSNSDPPSKTPASSGKGASNLKYGLLKDLGREEYMSPGGLRYTRGSAEGHRLKHIERHLKDQPSRPGSHGVFYGDMAQVIRWLDDTFDRAKSGAKGTRKKQEDRRLVLEAQFSKPVGYVGGQTGKRKGNPDAKWIRMVVEGDRVITAFPF